MFPKAGFGASAAQHHPPNIFWIYADDVGSSDLGCYGDLLGSFADLAGQSLAPGAGPDSMDMLPAILGKSKTGRRSLAEHAGTLGLVEGDWKYIEPGKGPKVNRNINTELGNDPTPQLYNMAEDPGETHNMATEFPERVQSMAAELGRIKRWKLADARS